MMRKAIVIVLSLTLPLVLLGCAAEVSQNEYDAILAELNAAQDEITDLEAERDADQSEIADLETERDAAQAEAARLASEIEDLKDRRVTEAWTTASERYTALRDSIGFDLEEIAPWVKLPEKPTWLDNAHLCSTILVDQPGAYEAACLITLPDQQLFMTLSEYGGITTAVCQGSNQEYLMTIIQDGAGDIVQVIMQANEIRSILSWTNVAGEKFFTATVDDEVYEVSWSDEPGELQPICIDFVNWLSTINKTGGLIAPSDQPLMFLGMGGLHTSLSTSLLANWKVIASRVLVDIMHGVPASGWW